MLRKKALAVSFLVCAVAAAQPVRAESIAVGALTFDTFILGPGGTNAFFISNLTGDPATGGFALPPDFPVQSSMTFDAPSLDWVSSGGSSSFDFGSVGIVPGFLFSDPAIQFPDSTDFVSATFSALLSTPIFQLTDGRIFQATSSSLFATLTAPGGVLAPGDFAVLTVEANEVASTVPEPATLLLLATGLAATRLRKKSYVQPFR